LKNIYTCKKESDWKIKINKNVFDCLLKK
jgi:hypothetical protein